jgi:hypothetical protein
MKLIIAYIFMSILLITSVAASMGEEFCEPERGLCVSCGGDETAGDEEYGGDIMVYTSYRQDESYRDFEYDICIDSTTLKHFTCVNKEKVHTYSEYYHAQANTYELINCRCNNVLQQLPPVDNWGNIGTCEPGCYNGMIEEHSNENFA